MVNINELIENIIQQKINKINENLKKKIAELDWKHSQRHTTSTGQYNVGYAELLEVAGSEKVKAVLDAYEEVGESEGNKYSFIVNHKEQIRVRARAIALSNTAACHKKLKYKLLRDHQTRVTPDYYLNKDAVLQKAERVIRIFIDKAELMLGSQESSKVAGEKGEHSQGKQTVDATKGKPLASNEAGLPGETASFPQNSYMTYREIAKHFGIKKIDALRKRLDRWEQSDRNAKARGYIIVTQDRAHNDPAKLYRISAVMPIVNKMLKKKSV